MTHIFLIVLFLFTGEEKTVLRGDDFQKVIAEFVNEQLKSTHAEMFVEYRSLPKEIQLKKGNYLLCVSTSKALPKKGYAGITVEIRNGKNTERVVLCSVIIRTFDDVLVTTKEIAKHEVIEVSTLIKQRIETTMLNEECAISADQLLGVRATRIIQANSAIKISMIEQIPLVQQKELVTLRVISKNITIETSGIAKDEGRFGDEIKVLRAGSREYVLGKVVGKQIVEIVVR